ncbi:MAG: ferredoxin [bacterium]
MVVRINKNLCIGCGSCTVMCPNNFRMGDDGKSEVINPEGSDCDQQAIEVCPVGAIEKD